MARGWFLKYFQRFKRKMSISHMHWNIDIKCWKVKTNLWLLHSIYFDNGTLCSKCLLSPFFSSEFKCVVSIQTKRAWWRFISFLTKKFSSADTILNANKLAQTSLLMGIRPRKCLEIDWFFKNVAYIVSCSIDITSFVSSVQKEYKLLCIFFNNGCFI